MAPENADADFASTCNWIFGHIKGMIKKKSMRIKIGHLFEDNDKPAPKLGHQVFITPSTFLIPSGLNRESALHLIANYEKKAVISVSL